MPQENFICVVLSGTRTFTGKTYVVFVIGKKGRKACNANHRATHSGGLLVMEIGESMLVIIMH